MGGADCAAAAVVGERVARVLYGVENGHSVLLDPCNQTMGQT
jgi:hypothetical protein